MLVRPYHPLDAEGLAQLTEGQGISDPRADDIFVTGEPGKPTGCLVYRPGAFIHELECGKDFARRRRADALVNYAVGHARVRGLHTGVFLVAAGNDGMVRFLESVGAVKQTNPGDLLYTLTP
jgi:ribosomal protein S18 acetylase RimI-like enzyme